MDEKGRRPEEGVPEPAPVMRCGKLGITAPLSGTLRGLHLPRTASDYAEGQNFLVCT